MADYQPMEIALIDAATNCARDGATVTITLRSGTFFNGTLERSSGGRTGHVKTRGGGWATFLVEEVASVEVRRG